MHLTRTIRIQLAVFTLISLISVVVMFIYYMQIPTEFLGMNRYTVTMKLPATGGLYKGGNVTYNGFEVGRVDDVRLTPDGAEAILKLDDATKIPADLKAEVHSVSAIGEQYVQLLPQRADGPSLKNGDVIPAARTSIPPDLNRLLDATNRGLDAIPRDNLKTVVDESYTAFAGLGPDLSRLVTGSTKLARDARKTLDAQMALIDGAKPVLDSQTNTSDSIQAWASNLASVTAQLHDNDSAVRGLIQKGPAAAGEVRDLLDRLDTSLPIALANLANVAQVGVTYRPDLEAILVLLPRGVEIFQGPLLPNRYGKHKSPFLDFNLNINIPRPCTTGYLPPQQIRPPAFEDWPDRPKDDLYCRVPQDSPFNVRGARNYPCETRPGKRAPTVKMCESDEEYRPLNDGWNWKGDPNATLSGQDIPQPQPVPPGVPTVTPPLPPVAVAQYDPATGKYVGPDGQTYTQENLANTADKEKKWQDLLVHPTQ